MKREVVVLLFLSAARKLRFAQRSEVNLRYGLLHFLLPFLLTAVVPEPGLERQN